MVPVPTLEKVTVPVPAPYLDHKKLIFEKNVGNFFTGNGTGTAICNFGSGSKSKFNFGSSPLGSGSTTLLCRVFCILFPLLNLTVF
jgi:hypothetical protein